ncbi:MAG: acyl carrier protein [Gammaproteobacteria bacterium]|nr:acyl carrier protein [Gammaproteobacteria bacterium]MDH5582882.1 acyl carrier protein [Gammaproteobacteria bacterium]
MPDSIRKVMSQIFDIDPSSIVAESSPQTIERWDSLKHMQLIMALEDEFGIRFSDDDIPELTSFKLIEDAINASEPD